MKTSDFFRFLLCFAFSAGFFTQAQAQWWGKDVNNVTNNTTPFYIYNKNPTISKVGIGITQPKQKLQIVGGNLMLDYTDVNGTTGNIFLGPPTYNPLSLPSGNAATDPTTNNGMRMSFYNGAAKNGFIDVRTNSALTDGLVFRVDQTNGGSERMRITAGGNVGIGIAAPQHMLHVAGRAMISGSTPGYGGPMLLFSNNTTTHPSGHWGIEYEPTQQGLNFFQPWNAGQTGFGNYYLFLKNDGKVGMGIDPTSCANPFPGNYRLYVKDGILTEKVKVANYCSAFWADYVFAPDYKLQPLAEVESFIAENRHLPGIPSAEEVEKEGLDLADMLSKQMAKIEELTLHAIEMNKRLEKLEAENAALQQARR